MEGVDELFVTEEPGLHTRVIRGIHHIAIDGDAVRIFTYDKIPHRDGVEQRVNGDFLFKRDDLMNIIGQVSEYLHRNGTEKIAAELSDGLMPLRRAH